MHERSNLGQTDKMYNKSLFSLDPPGEAEVLMIEEVLLKGDDGHFECFLTDPGNPRTEQFLWRL